MQNTTFGPIVFAKADVKWEYRERSMWSVTKLLKQFKSDEDGAALIEYTVLLAVLLVGVIAVIGAVGGWINGQWTHLSAMLAK